MTNLRNEEKNIGLFVGRFEPLTIGHCLVINEAIKSCDKLILVLGSTQESLTKKNPFNATLRAFFITKVYEKEILEGKMILAFVPDRTHPKDDEEWGKYLLNEVHRQTSLTPNIVYEGSENVRNYRFNESVKRVTFPKILIPINASMIREYILNDDYQKFKEFMPKEISSKEYYEAMRKIIIEVNNEE